MDKNKARAKLARELAPLTTRAGTNLPRLIDAIDAYIVAVIAERVGLHMSAEDEARIWQDIEGSPGDDS